MERHVAFEVVHRLAPGHVRLDLSALDYSRNRFRGAFIDQATESIAFSTQRVSGADAGMNSRSWS